MAARRLCDGRRLRNEMSHLCRIGLKTFRSAAPLTHHLTIASALLMARPVFDETRRSTLGCAVESLHRLFDLFRTLLRAIR